MRTKLKRVAGIILEAAMAIKAELFDDYIVVKEEGVIIKTPRQTMNIGDPK